MFRWIWGVSSHFFLLPLSGLDLNPEMAALADISSQVGDRACPHVPFASHVKNVKGHPTCKCEPFQTMTGSLWPIRHALQ